MQIENNIMSRVDALIARLEDQNSKDSSLVDECSATAVTLCEGIYGAGSIQVKRLLAEVDRVIKTNPHNYNYPLRVLLVGSLRSLREDVKNGRVAAMVRDAISGVVLDFISLAERALNEGRTDVASVLAAASFEDAVRNKAEHSGLAVEGKDLLDLVNALKAGGALGGTQAKVVSSYVPFRNKALHAEWEKIQAPEVAGLIAFLKLFVLADDTREHS